MAESFPIRIHLFARCRDLAGAEIVAVELPSGATVSRLRRYLADRHPALALLLEHCAIAVNHDFAAEDRVLSASDEIAIIPPVSGG